MNNRTLSIDSNEFFKFFLPEFIKHKHKYLRVGPWVESYTTFNECVG